MSILIKDIDMPKGYVLRIEIEPNGTVWEEGRDWIKHRQSAIQIDRPHGRLIDGDKIMKDLGEWKQNPNNDDEAVVFVNHFQGIIRTEPTILEAEE